jgi:hypothetical protein
MPVLSMNTSLHRATRRNTTLLNGAKRMRPAGTSRRFRRGIDVRSAEYVPLRAGDRLVRLIATVDEPLSREGKAPRFAPTAFNPTQVKDNPRVRGRFSSVAKWPAGEQYSYYYAAQDVDGHVVAMSEFFVREGVEHSQRDDGFLPVARASFDGLAFVEVLLARDIKLLDVTNEPKARKVFARYDELHGRNFRLTRRYAKYFRENIPGLQGIAYVPTRIKNTSHGCNIVIFGDAKDPTKNDHLEAHVRFVPTESDEGSRILERSRRNLGVVLL